MSSPIAPVAPARRSFLYVPGNRPDRLSKALDRAGDAVIVDLEDAVAAADKDAARQQVSAWLGRLTQARPQLWVRVNSGALMATDVAAIVSPLVHGIVVPKADPDALAEADRALSTAEQATGLTAGRVQISPLIESAAGLAAAPVLANAARVSHLSIGEADLAADLRLIEPDEQTWLPIRLQIVVASAAAGLVRPTGPVDTDIHNLKYLAATSQALRRLGFGARSVLHPDQVAVVERAFAPTDAEVTRARQVLEAYDGSSGGGGIDENGRFIDAAVVRSARQILSAADDGPTP